MESWWYYRSQEVRGSLIYYFSARLKTFVGNMMADDVGPLFKPDEYET